MAQTEPTFVKEFEVTEKCPSVEQALISPLFIAQIPPILVSPKLSPNFISFMLVLFCERIPLFIAQTEP